MNKYRNKTAIVDGVRFDSLKEAARWGHLKLLAKAGLITDLERQTRYAIKVNGQLICHYKPDFTYFKRGEGKRTVEDVKSPITRKNPVYRLKSKLMKAVYDIDIVEI